MLGYMFMAYIVMAMNDAEAAARHVRIDVCMHLCIDLRIDMCPDVCAHICADMCGGSRSLTLGWS